MLQSVGGATLAVAVSVARDGARVVVLARFPVRLAPAGTGRTARVELDSFTFLLRRITVLGYSADDHPEPRGAWNTLYAEALAAARSAWLG